MKKWYTVYNFPFKLAYQNGNENPSQYHYSTISQKLPLIAQWILPLHIWGRSISGISVVEFDFKHIQFCFQMHFELMQVV